MREDDDAGGLPGLDGGVVEGAERADDDRGIEADVDLDVGDEEASSLDDAAAGDLDAPESDEDEESESGLDWDETDGDPMEADPSLTDGDEGGWTEGSETHESDPWDEEDDDAEERDLGVDRGEEGVDEHGASGLDDAFLPSSEAADLDGDADDLDVREDAAIDATGHEADTTELPQLDLPTQWLGPSGEAARTVEIGAGGVFLVAGGLLEVSGGALVPVTRPSIENEGEITSVSRRGAELAVGTNAGEVFLLARDAASESMTRRALPRPGTRDGSLGAIDTVALDTALVVRSRGGALFRSNVDESGWVGPVIARPVRLIRGSVGAGDASEWLLALVGTHAEPGGDELMASTDARRFERVALPTRRPGTHVVGMARAGSTLALAISDGPVMITRDVGATWAPIATLRDAQQVWLSTERGAVVLYAALFHEASDRGQLVRLPMDGEPVVILDVANETRKRRLGGPGDPDGDGRVHDLAIESDDARTVLWIATGVGLFRVEAAR